MLVVYNKGLSALSKYSQAKKSSSVWQTESIYPFCGWESYQATSSFSLRPDATFLLKRTVPSCSVTHLGAEATYDCPAGALGSFPNLTQWTFIKQNVVPPQTFHVYSFRGFLLTPWSIFSLTFLLLRKKL